MNRSIWSFWPAVISFERKLNYRGFVLSPGTGGPVSMGRALLVLLPSTTAVRFQIKEAAMETIQFGFSKRQPHPSSVYLNGTPSRRVDLNTSSAARVVSGCSCSSAQYLVSLYTGGWNISSRHYMASVAFSAAPAFLRRGLVPRLRPREARLLLLLPVLPRQDRQRLHLLPQDLRRLPPPPPPHLHGGRRHRLRCALPRAGEAGRQHVRDAAVRGEPVGRRDGEPERVRRVHRDGQGGRWGVRGAAA